MVKVTRFYFLSLETFERVGIDVPLSANLTFSELVWSVEFLFLFLSVSLSLFLMNFPFMGTLSRKHAR